MHHANVTALCLIEQELLPIKVLHCENRSFRPFWLLWPWPDDLHIRTRPVDRGDIPHVQIWTSYVKAFESYRLEDIRYIQTRPKLYTTPRGELLVELLITQLVLTCCVQHRHERSSTLLINLTRDGDSRSFNETAFEYIIGLYFLISTQRSQPTHSTLFPSMAQCCLS